MISRQNYAHNLDWFGVQIFQTPTDLFLYQQLIFRARPIIIIESGVAQGGSILFACQMLDMIHGNSSKNQWKVICCDINSTQNAQTVVRDFGYQDNVIFYEGDSAGGEFQSIIRKLIERTDNPQILLSLDSNHTEIHVYNELLSLSTFVSKNSFAIIWDSRIGDLSKLTHYLRPRAWSKKHNAGTGVLRFINLQENSNMFENCQMFERSLYLTGTKNGVLRRIS